MTKFITAFLAVFVLAFSGCGDDTESETPTTESVEDVAESDAGTEVTDAAEGEGEGEGEAPAIDGGEENE